MTNELLNDIKKRLRAYNEAKNVYDEYDARVAIEGQALGDIEELVAEVERLREVVRRVHGLVDEVTTIALPEAVHMLADIHQLTKGGDT